MKLKINTLKKQKIIQNKKSYFKKKCFLYIFLIVGLTLFGCSSLIKQPKSHSLPFSPSSESLTPLEENEKPVSEVNERLKNLETQLKAMHEKLDALHHLIAPPINPDSSLKSVNIIDPPLSQSTMLMEPPLHEIQSGFISDEAIQTFRKAFIFLQGEKHQNAIILFSEFLIKWPNHPLAGSAQFHIGEATLKTQGPKEGLEEFKKIIYSYGNSSHVSNALAEICFLEKKLNQEESFLEHYQLLNSLFPTSPARRKLQARLLETEAGKELIEKKEFNNSKEIHKEKPKNQKVEDPSLTPPETLQENQRSFEEAPFEENL